MRVTLLGHASLLIETEDLTILTDPTFGESALDGIAQFCPRRKLDPTALPPIDILYISHIHTDHFDIESLATLPENVDTVVTPQDPFIIGALERLGFESIQPIVDNQVIGLEGTTMRITPSRFKVPEHGIIVSDKSGRVWNQVDTLAVPEWLPNVHNDGPIDVHFANFSPLSWYHILVGGDISFPLDVYRDQFDVVRHTRAKLVIPASCGLSFREPFSFMNRFWFPLMHERFIEDVKAVTDCQTALLRPGDAIEIGGDNPEVIRQARAELVATTDPSMDEYRFDPTAEIPPLRDLNPRDVATGDLSAAVKSVIDKLTAAIRDPAKRPLLDRMRPWGVRLQIEVRFPGGEARRWSVDLSNEQPALEEGGSGRANYFFTTTASGLHSVERGLAWDEFFYFGYRAFHSVYTVQPQGIFAPQMPEQGRLGVGAIPQPHDFVVSLWEPSPQAWIDNRIDRALADQ